MDARDIIISSLRQHGTLREVASLLGCGWSSLYQLARHERHLGPELAKKMRTIVDLPESVWLSAMGIDCDVRVTDAP
jgi:plasmid maintenance system antidote protein VapI